MKPSPQPLTSVTAYDAPVTTCDTPVTAVRAPSHRSSCCVGAVCVRGAAVLYSGVSVAVVCRAVYVCAGDAVRVAVSSGRPAVAAGARLPAPAPASAALGLPRPTLVDHHLLLWLWLQPVLADRDPAQPPAPRRLLQLLLQLLEVVQQQLKVRGVQTSGGTR